MFERVNIKGKSREGNTCSTAIFLVVFPLGFLLKCTGLWKEGEEMKTKNKVRERKGKRNKERKGDCREQGLAAA